MKAARECHKDIVQKLLRSGAQMDVLNYEQMNARDVTLNAEIDKILAENEGKGIE